MATWLPAPLPVPLLGGLAAAGESGESGRWAALPPKSASLAPLLPGLPLLGPGLSALPKHAGAPPPTLPLAVPPPLPAPKALALPELPLLGGLGAPGLLAPLGLAVLGVEALPPPPPPEPGAAPKAAALPLKVDRPPPRDMLCLLPQEPGRGPSYPVAIMNALLSALVGEEGSVSSRVAKAWSASVAPRPGGKARETAATRLKAEYAGLTPMDELRKLNGERDRAAVAAFVAAVESRCPGPKRKRYEGVSKALQAALATNTNLGSAEAELVRRRAALDEGDESESVEPAEAPPPPPPPPQAESPAAGVPPPGTPAGRSPAVAEAAPAVPAKPPASGFAMASMLSRAAENAKRSAQSRQAAGEALAVRSRGGEGALSASDKAKEAKSMLFLGSIPRGTGEGLILAECAKYGVIQSIFYKNDADAFLEDRWALVRFDGPAAAAAAAERAARRVGLFGATAAEPLTVHVAQAEDIDRMLQARDGSVGTADEPTGGGNGAVLGEAAVAAPIALQGRQQAASTLSSTRRIRIPLPKAGPEERLERPRSRSRSRRRRSRQGDRKRRRRHRGRSLEVSVSRSSSSGGAAPDAGRVEGGVLAIPEEKPRRGLGGFDATPALVSLPGSAGAGGAGFADRPCGGRQVSARGSWAEYALMDGRSYYVNIVTKEATWSRPPGYEAVASRRGMTGIPGPPMMGDMGNGHSNLFIGNLPAGMDDITFRQLFCTCGTVVSVKTCMEQRYGFVKYACKSDAQKVIDVMNGAVLNGVQLAVRFANMDRRL